jgi:hypothetical protein
LPFEAHQRLGEAAWRGTKEQLVRGSFFDVAIGNLMLDIVQLKTAQDELNKRKQHLLEHFIPFRDGLFNRLEEWSREAVAQDLEGVVVARRQINTEQLIELSCTLNGFYLLFIASCDVARDEPPGEGFYEPTAQPLAARILGFPSDDPEEAAYFDFRVLERGDTYQFKAIYRANDKIDQ